MNNTDSPIKRIKQVARRWRLRRHGVIESVSIPGSRIGAGSGTWVTSTSQLDINSVVYSFGAGTDISFDLDLYARTGARVHIFDPTPRSIEWIDRQTLPNGVVFHPYGIGAQDGSISFYPPRRSSSSHFSPVKRYRTRQYGEVIHAPVFCLSTIMQKLGHTTIDILKMDIEGGEFDVVAGMLDEGLPANQLLIEFHHNYSTIPLSRTVDTVKRLAKAGFECFNISPRTYEMSFVRTNPMS